MEVTTTTRELSKNCFGIVIIFIGFQIFQTSIVNKIRVRNKSIIDWNVQDVVNWLKDIDLDDVAKIVMNSNMDGERLLTTPEESICAALNLGNIQLKNF